MTYYKARARLRVIRLDREAETRIPTARKWWLRYKGFLSERQILYGLTRSNVSLYLSDAQRLAARHLNAPYQVILNDKFLFDCVLSKCLRVPRNIARVKQGGVHTFDNDCRAVSLQELLQTEAGHGWVFKPKGGGAGIGISILRLQDDRMTLDNRPVTLIELETFVAKLDEYLVTEFIVQGAYASALYPHTTNTIRLLMLRDPDNDEVFFPMAAQRIGTSKSAPMDNFTRGGLSAAIDMRTGELGSAAAHAYEGELRWHDHHPDTGAPIKGMKVPQWTAILEQIKKAAQQFDFLNYVGWDIAILDDGFAVIEGNSFPDPDVLQLHQPLLAIPQVRRFYQHHGIVNR